jgi:hypothetical protein
LQQFFSIRPFQILLLIPVSFENRDSTHQPFGTPS